MLDSFIILIIGFGAAFLGTTPPGLLNLTAAKTQAIYGSKKANLFMLGSSSVSALYSFIAASLTSFLESNPVYLQDILLVGLIIFAILTIVFAYKGFMLNKNGPKPVNNERSNFFITGVLLSIINILPFPFYIAITYFLQNLISFNYSVQQILILVIGVFSGTYAILFAYTVANKKLKAKWSKPEKKPSKFNSNYLMATITGIIVIITAIKLYLKQ